jgi:enoyl-[acyl-carrier protein] reductase I
MPLNGKKGLVIGIANEHSLAYSCGRHFRAAGAAPGIGADREGGALRLTWINERSRD